MNMDAAELVSGRRHSNGDYAIRAELAQRLKAEITHYSREAGVVLSAAQSEALESIMTKVSRIVCGDPNHTDSWDDISGYAYLGGHGEPK